jgi:hypothetical protein
MLRLALFIVLLATQPAFADGFFENPCKEDLVEALNKSADDFEFRSKYFPDEPNLAARGVGVTHVLCIDELINLAGKIDMSQMPFAKKHFIEELEWARDLFKKDMSEIYRQSEHYKAQKDIMHAYTIAIFLHQWAVEHHYPPAEFDLSQGYGSYNGELNESRLMKLAERGYMPAIVDAARRFMSGDGVDKNVGEAWYWLKRAQQENVDTSSITKKSLNRLLEEMNEEERWALTSLSYSHDDLDLTNIDVPPSFMPLTAKIPDPLSDEEEKTFIKKFKGLRSPKDDKIYDAIESELVVRTTGIQSPDNGSIHPYVRPFGMSKNEFMLRKCNYIQAIGKVFPQGDNQDDNGKLAHLNNKAVVLISLTDKASAQNISDIIQCGDLHPNPGSKAISSALSWAKGLEKMTPADLRELAAQHVEKSEPVSEAEYKRYANNNNSKNEVELEPLMHFALAKAINIFARFKERRK